MGTEIRGHVSQKVDLNGTDMTLVGFRGTLTNISKDNFILS